MLQKLFYLHSEGYVAAVLRLCCCRVGFLFTPARRLAAFLPMLFVEIFLQLRWLELCPGEYGFTGTGTEAFKVPHFFICTWNQNERGHHSISFSSTWWKVMMIIRNWKSLYYYLYLRSCREDLHVSPKHFYKNDKWLQYERQCTRFLSFALQSIRFRTIY